MANINLISARRAERVRLTRVTRGLLAGIAGTTVVGFGAFSLLAFQLLAVNAHFGDVQAKLIKLRPILKQIEADQAERAALQPKILTLTEAQKKTQRWYDILEGMKRAIPEETWLTNLAVEKGAVDTPGALRLTGTTVSQTRVGETMYRLTQQPNYYKKVDLRFTQTNQVDTHSEVAFELVAQLVGTEPEKKKDDHNAPKTN